MTGLAYLWMRYVLVSSDPFSVINHPWQPAMLKIHLLAAPGLILIFGIVFQSHIARKLGSPDRANRRSGWLSLVTFALMTASGYLLQTVTSPTAVQLVWWLHLASSGVFTVGYTTHLLLGLSQLRSLAGRSGTTVATSES